jgi:hypothetical protein
MKAKPMSCAVSFASSPWASDRAPFARTLNKEGVPGPNGRLWNDTTIRGHVKRGTGLVNNELYRKADLESAALRQGSYPRQAVSRFNPRANGSQRRFPNCVSSMMNSGRRFASVRARSARSSSTSGKPCRASHEEPIEQR